MTTRPNVIATPTWVTAPVRSSTTTAPVPANTRMNVPIVSAAYLLAVGGVTQSPRLLEGRGERLDEGPDLVADAAVVAERRFLGGGGLREFGRIVEADVDDLRAAGERGAALVGVAADGHDVFEADVLHLVHVLRVLAGDVDARLAHDADGV